MKLPIKEKDFSKYSKKQIVELAKSNANEDVEIGVKSTLSMYLFSKTLIEYLTAYNENIHEAAMSEYDEHGEKELNLHGRKITKFEAGTKYDFSNCNHPKLDALTVKEKEVKSESDGVKKFLKSLSEKTTIIDEESGEVIELYPPIKKSKTTIKVSY